MGAAPSCDYSDYVAKKSVEQELRTVERQIEDCASSSKCNYSAELADYVRRADILDTHTLKTTCANDSPCMQNNNNFDVAVKKYPIMFVPRTMGTVGKACDAVVCPLGTTKRSSSLVNLDATVTSCCIVPSTCAHYLKSIDKTCAQLNKTKSSGKESILPMVFDEHQPVATIQQYMTDTCCI